MNIKKIEKKVHEIAPSVKVEEYNGCVRLTGELDKWADVYKCGRAAVCKDSLGVLNDITLKGYTSQMKVPSVKDNSLDGKKVDVLVIGGGITGCAILREVMRLNVSALLVEKANDVAMASSSRNDGCIHVGIDLHKGQQKLKYVLRGNELYDTLKEDLDIQFKRWAQMVMFSTKWEKTIIPPLFKLKAKMLGIKQVEFYKTVDVKNYEPDPPSWCTGAMFMGTGGVISPYKTTVALANNAIENGAEISLSTVVLGMETKDGKVVSVSTNRGTIYPKIVVNAAGVFSDKIAEMAGDRTFTIHPRKGTDIILDKKKAGYALSSYNRSYFAPLPEANRPDVTEDVGHTKGGGVMRTVDNNILVGPDAHEVPDREDYTTNMLDINNMLKKQVLCAEKMTKADVITYFSGIRAATYEEDFVVRRGIFTKNIYEAAGIQSPGITAAPAIAEDIVKWIREDYKFEDNKAFNPKYTHTPRLADLPDEEREKWIKKNAAYGEIVCRCEEVSKGEIIDALEQPLHVATVDGVKRRVRPGMGRCQGGFCSPTVAKIIAEHEGIAVEEVLKSDGNSNFVFGDTKGGNDND